MSAHSLVSWMGIAGKIEGKETNAMPASKRSAKKTKQKVPKSAKIKLSDMTPKKQPKGSLGFVTDAGCTPKPTSGCPLRLTVIRC